MPAKQSTKPKPKKSFEETLWDTATKLRGSVESADWSGATKRTRQGSPEGERGGANQNGVAGFDSVHLRFAPVVLANGSMSTNTKGEGEIRQKLVENDLVDTALRESAISNGEATPQAVSEAKDNMIALPGQLFYTTQIPVCPWFLTKNKKADSEHGKLDESASLASPFPIAA